MMEVTHFVVPAAAYPRYRYTRQHLTPLLKRFQKLTQKCNITDPFSIPTFGDVNIYAVSDVESDILNIDEIAPRCNTEIERTCIKCKDVDEFRSQCPDDGTSIHIASYKRATENDTLLQYFGRYNVLVTKEEEQIEAKTPEYKTIDDNITCLKTKKNLATEINLLCERILFRELYKRVKVLTKFLDLDPTDAVFATLDQDIEVILKKRYDKSRTFTVSRPVPAERDALHLYDEWCSARLSAIRNKILSEYGKSVPEVRNQLLDLDANNTINGRNILPLKICEHIIPYLDAGPVPPESKQIPEALLSQIKVMQKSEETTRKAVHLESRFKNHLDLVHKHKDEISQLYDESMGMYHRSKVPEYERPTRKQTKPPTPLSENVVKGFLSIKGVKGCGYRFRTLNIYITDSLTKEEREQTAENVKQVAGNYGIMECKVRTEQEEVTKFADYGVGSTLTSQFESSASLGGFALKGKNRDLSLLTARHFADGSRNIFVNDTDGKKYQIAYVLKPPPNTVRHATLDIAAANVLEDVRPHCVTMFKDESGLPLPSKLTIFEELDIEWLKGLPVHIWGAVSSPGLGKIVIPDYYVEGMKRLVKIEDSHPVDTEDIVPLCQAGDSGAIVCADDPDGEIVHVISMLMGSSNYEAKEKDKTIKGEYLSIRLKDGLWQLEQELGDNFSLC